MPAWEVNRMLEKETAKAVNELIRGICADWKSGQAVDAEGLNAMAALITAVNGAVANTPPGPVVGFTSPSPGDDDG